MLLSFHNREQRAAAQPRYAQAGPPLPTLAPIASRRFSACWIASPVRNRCSDKHRRRTSLPPGARRQSVRGIISAASAISLRLASDARGNVIRNVQLDICPFVSVAGWHCATTW